MTEKAVKITNSHLHDPNRMDENDPKTGPIAGPAKVARE